MADLQPDDVMPNDGTYFGLREPVEQVVARRKEKAKTLEALSVIKKVIDHFDQRITARDSLASISVDLTVDPLLHQKICAVNELLKAGLIEEKQMLEELLEIHAPNL